MSIAFIVITALVIIVSVLLVALILAQKKGCSWLYKWYGWYGKLKYLLGSEQEKFY